MVLYVGKTSNVNIKVATLYRQISTTSKQLLVTGMKTDGLTLTYHLIY